MQRPRDVLDLMIAAVFERDVQLALRLLMGVVRNGDPAGRRQPLEARGDVHAVAQYIVTIDHDIANIDADAIEDALIIGQTGFPLAHRPLDIHRTFDRVDRAGEFHQHAIAGGFHDPPLVSGDFRVDQVCSMGALTRNRAGFIDLHMSRVADHIGR